MFAFPIDNPPPQNSRDNLYEFAKYNRQSETEAPYFTTGRIQIISRHILKALKFIHSMNMIHCDLKPENILMKSYSRSLAVASSIFRDENSCRSEPEAPTFSAPARRGKLGRAEGIA